MRLEFYPEAEMELIEAAAHYELQVPGLGERFEAEVRRATDILLDHPDIGAPADPHLRRFIVIRHDELVRWLRAHRYADPVPQRLADKAARQADAAARPSDGR